VVNDAFVIPAPPIASLAVVGTDKRFPVRRIYCVGKNYLSHVKEMGEDERAPPVIFQKPADSIVEDGATIPYPVMTDDYHYELELVVALRSGGYNIPEIEALDHVYGYGISLDMTRRDIQLADIKRGHPWEPGKSFDQSCPCGPIRRAEEIGHVDKGRIQLIVNGAIKQDADLELMIWRTPEIIARLSQQYRLCPGDLILTGTPSGVGPVVPGDEMVGTIEGLGTLTVRIGPPVA